jgi:toxin-antitoxin system PIN domain toxin
MPSFFPDLNVWFALSVEGRLHGGSAWQWLNTLPSARKLIFCRHTHLGLLRLLTSTAAMGKRVMTIAEALEVYDAWLGDPRVVFFAEPRDMNSAIANALAPFKKQSVSHAVADCYLLAFAKEAGATLVTFDQPLWSSGCKHGYKVIRPV